MELDRQEGKYDSATSFGLQIVDILEHSGESDKSPLATSLNNLAILYEEAGKDTEAETLFKRTIETAEQTSSGVSGEALANDLNNLARLYREKSNYIESEKCYKRSLELRRSLFNSDDLRVAASLRNYADLLQKMNRNAEANKLNKEAATIESKNNE